MTDHMPRLFESDAEIVRIDEGLLSRTLPKPNWTHEAHLATTTYLLTRRPDIDIDKQLPGFIRAYNESVGGVNSDSEGYHETITRVFLRGVWLFLAEADFKERERFRALKPLPAYCLDHIAFGASHRLLAHAG